MPLVKSPALVVRSRSYRETSLMFSALTPDQGILYFLGKGFRDKHHGFVSPFEPLTLVEVIFYERTRSRLQLLKEADALDSFSTLRKDISLYARACFFVELVEQMTWGPHQEPSIFHLLIQTLRCIGTVDLEELSGAFQIQLLGLAGFSPELERCVFCREEDLERARFSYEQGGLVCRHCGAGVQNTLPLSAGTLESMRYLARMPFEKALRLRVGQRSRAELRGILRKFIAYRLEGELRTLRVLDQLEHGLKA